MDDSTFLVDFSSYEYAYGEPRDTARIKCVHADFRVEENLGFEPDDVGEHLWIKIRKTGLSTIEVVQMIAATLGLKTRDIGYSGMKDKHAVCSQWFSVPRSGIRDGNVAKLEGAAITVLDARNNSRKLKIGTHRCNDFTIILREFTGAVTTLEERFAQVISGGVPNYFGPQRFGQDGKNVVRALDYFSPTHGTASRVGHTKSRLYVSALRSFVFNQLLSLRVQQRTWNKMLPGEVLNLDGTKRFFKPQISSSVTSSPANMAECETILQRVAAMDVHPTGVLCGKLKARDRYLPEGEAETIERSVLQQYSEICAILVDKSITVSRRPLRLVCRNPELCLLNPQTVKLQFTLARGGYATTVLRELCRIAT